MNIGEVKALADRVRVEVAKAIIGQKETVDLLLTALFARGHVLIEGPPGTAKTFLAQCFARATSLEFGRIQFTPDLMPGDIIGSSLFDFQTSRFRLVKGPVFCQLLLADEINRTPPKTQAALLEAMQERAVTIDGERHDLGDRFMFKVFVRYPKFEEEFEIARRTTALLNEEITPVLHGEEILDLQKLVRRVPVSDHVIRYTLALVRQTRLGEPGVPKFIRDWLSWGAGPPTGRTSNCSGDMLWVCRPWRRTTARSSASLG